MKENSVFADDNNGTIVIGDEASVENFNDSLKVLEERVEHDIFLLDTQCCQEEQNTALEEKDEKELSLLNILTQTTPNGSNSSNAKDSWKGRRQNTCFNCLGEHIVADCPEQIDQSRISRNRNKLLAKKRESFMNTPRFHENGRDFEPGTINNELRDALGIGSRDIPPWIFRMRRKGFIEGYPPGYRTKAIEKSTLKFVFTDDKNNETQDDIDDFSFDSSKIIRYPGFNSEDRGLADPEVEIFKVPPWHIYLSAFEQYVAELNSRVREGKRLRGELPFDQVVSRGKRRGDQNHVRNDYNSESHSILSSSASLGQKPLRGLSTNSNLLLMHSSLVLPPPPPPPFDEFFDQPSNKKTRSNDVDSNKPPMRYIDATLEEGEIFDESLIEIDSIADESSINGVLLNTSSSKSVLSISVKQPNPETVSILSEVSLGTPIPMQRHISGDKLNHEFIKPSLDKWAQDIQPFQHTEPPKTEHVGLFKKIRQVIKNAGKKTNNGLNGRK